jgi:glycosyltransferase involved in cell wall biosynthesis
LLRLIKALPGFGFEAAVVSLRSEGALGPLVRAEGVPLTALGMPALSHSISALQRLSKLIERFRPAVVQGWMYHGNIAALLSASRKPWSAHVAWGIRQSLGAGNRDKLMTRFLIRVGAHLSERPAAIIYNSAVARRHHETRGFAAVHGVVIPNGFDTETFRPDPHARNAVRRALDIPAASPVVGHVARLHPSKDHMTFLRAAERIARHESNAVFVLAGEGVDGENSTLAQAIGELGLQARVRLLGRREDIARLLPAFDVVCLTSCGMEGFPNALGEAMSCGVPCVTTDVGDAADLVGSTGRVVPIRDPDAVAAAVVELLSHDPLRLKLGSLARGRIIEQYSIARFARRYASLYADISRTY